MSFFKRYLGTFFVWMISVHILLHVWLSHSKSLLTNPYLENLIIAVVMLKVKTLLTDMLHLILLLEHICWYMLYIWWTGTCVKKCMDNSRTVMWMSMEQDLAYDIVIPLCHTITCVATLQDMQQNRPPPLTHTHTLTQGGLSRWLVSRFSDATLHISTADYLFSSKLHHA